VTRKPSPKVVRVSEQTAAEKVTPWLKIQILSIAGGLSYLGSSMSTFAVILRDKDVVGPVGVSVIFLSMLLPNILMAPISGQIADQGDLIQISHCSPLSLVRSWLRSPA
jgi:hypothetical protein